MADDPQYGLTFAGIPFVLDQAITVRLNSNGSALKDRIPDELMSPRKFQTMASLMDELNRKLPWDYLDDFVSPPTYPGRNLGAIARTKKSPDSPRPTVKAGEFFYPLGAARWSVFRMFATSTLTKAMVASCYTGGSSARPLVMSNLPILPDDPSASNYSITTPMYMLPPRCLGETGGGLDGLYLITLVDERWYWQWKQVTLGNLLTKDTTWAELVSAIGTALGVSISGGSADPAYFQPEQDSQLWSNSENAAVLLDSVAANIGKVVVRALDGSYALLTNTESENIQDSNRGSATAVQRLAGGDMFENTGKLPVGSLSTARNAVVPQSVTVTFPQYIIGNDPVPHLVNTRYRPQRPSAWYEESYGAVYSESVPILSGGHAVSGMAGIGTHSMHTTAKALYSGEVQLAAMPLNVSGLTSLALAMATSYWESQAQSSLDEVYPGIYAWEPEGYNDILWVWSKDRRLCSTRVMRQEWNQIYTEFQHSTPPVVELLMTNTPMGVGGPSVAQTWRDSYTVFSGNVQSKTLLSGMTAAHTKIGLANVNYLPTDQRWRGVVESEIMLLEGTSGGAVVDVVYRGIDGTITTAHLAGTSITWLQPNTAYGVNLVTMGKGFIGGQAAWQSGGIEEFKLQCPLRTVQIQDNSGTQFTAINGTRYYSGIVNDYDPSKASGLQFLSGSFCWVQERNGLQVVSGKYYDGQLVGYSLSGQIQPIYLINAPASLINSRDQYSVTATPLLAAPLLSGDAFYSINDQSYLPTENRWVALIDAELFLMEGTSGGKNSLGIVQRSFNGTSGGVTGGHLSGAAVQWQLPDSQSGINLTTYDKGFFAFYGAISGNVEARLRCPLRSIKVVDISGVMMNGTRHYSGQVCDYDPTAASSGAPYTNFSPIWVVERNNVYPQKNFFYDGQLVAFSTTVSGNATFPVYSINVSKQLNARDQYAISLTNPTLTANLLSGDTSYSIDSAQYLPTENRWVALVDNELMVMDGTSGGINSLSIVARAFNGTLLAQHTAGATVAWQKPDCQSGITLTTYDKGFFAFYGSGLDETILRCPLRTVAVLDGAGTLIKGYRHFSGRVMDYNPSTANNPYVNSDLIWVVERNSLFPGSGQRYGGQLVAFSASGAVAPVYAINTFSGGGGGGSSSGDTFIGFKYYGGSCTITGAGSGRINFTDGNQLWDTHNFHHDYSGTLFDCSGGGAGTYHLHLYASLSASFNTTGGTVGPNQIYTAGCQGATGDEAEGALDTFDAFRLKYVDDPFGTATVEFNYDSASLEWGTDVDITTVGDGTILEMWAGNAGAYDTDVIIGGAVVSCHKVNRAASITN